MSPLPKRSSALVFCGLVLLARPACAAPVTANFTSAATVAVTAAGYTAGGNTVDITLGFAPPAGTNLTVVNNTGADFIQGTFDNLTQGQAVTLSYGGIDYPFVANYYGSSGNDLVLEWANTRLVGWGYNNNGEPGIGNSAKVPVPAPVYLTGPSSGKGIVGATTGSAHSIVTCWDGTLAGTGNNANGQLADGTTTNRTTPGAADLTAFAGRSIVTVAGGASHSIALLADGSLYAWGYNIPGQLGNGTTSDCRTPTGVVRAAVLYGKVVTAVAVGGNHNLALCSDGTLAAWGANESGQLGNNSTAYYSSFPIAVDRSGILAGKTVVAIAAGLQHSLALCSDGTLAAWGANSSGQLGNGSNTNSSTAVMVNTSGFLTGERFVAVAGCLAMVASPPRPVVATLAATGVTDTEATLNGNTNASDSDTTVSFEYGLTTSYGSVMQATPSQVTGVTDTGASASLAGLLAGTTYHYRVRASSAGGTVTGGDMTFTTSTFSCLSSLTFGSSTLGPVFDKNVTGYSLTVPFSATTVTCTPVVDNAGAGVTVAGVSVESAATSDPLGLTTGNNRVEVEVTAPDGITTRTYTVTVTRLPEVFAYNSATDVPVTVGAFVATGNTVTFALNFIPAAGTVLTVVRNSGLGFIQGQFDNLAQGQAVELTYEGKAYRFVANYYGGSGNDLVLQWASTEVFAWGSDGNGQLGNWSTANCYSPVPVSRNCALTGKIAKAVSAGYNHTVVLCTDGTVVSWGYGSSGQLGFGLGTLDTSAGLSYSSLPVALDQTRVLAGKTVVKVSAGGYYSLAVCSDGTVAAWGYNNYGQLGNGTTTNSNVPVVVSQSGVLAGKTVVDLAAGYMHNLALCSDGSVVAWGPNTYGGLGDGTTNNSSVPVLVMQDGVLAGKTVLNVAGGSGHSLALCSDGTIVAWGVKIM